MKLNPITNQVPNQHNMIEQKDIQKVHTDQEQENESTQVTDIFKHAVEEKEAIQSIVDKLNDFNDPEYTNLEFVFHDKLEKYYVTVINPNTEEVIKEIPPKKMLDMYAEMAEYMGILVDEKV